MQGLAPSLVDGASPLGYTYSYIWEEALGRPYDKTNEAVQTHGRYRESLTDRLCTSAGSRPLVHSVHLERSLHGLLQLVLLMCEHRQVVAAVIGLRAWPLESYREYVFA